MYTVYSVYNKEIPTIYLKLEFVSRVNRNLAVSTAVDRKLKKIKTPCLLVLSLAISGYLRLYLAILSYHGLPGAERVLNSLERSLAVTSISCSKKRAIKVYLDPK